MTKITAVFILITLINCLGCQDTSLLSGNIKVSINDSKPVISEVTVKDDQIIVVGKNLQDVTVAKVEGSTNHDFKIESKSPHKLILNARSVLNFLVGQSLNLIVSHAHAAATFPISFELQNGQVTAAHLNNMGATSGQVLRFNGTNWAPANLANSQIYAGTYNAATDTPDIVSAAGPSGTYYIVTTAGSQDLGSGMTAFDVGDWVIFNGTSWEKIEVGANTVSNFNGRTGAVVPLSGDYSWSMLEKTAGKLSDSKISEIEDVDVTGIQDGDILIWNNTNSKWEVGEIPAPVIASGSVTNTAIVNSAVDSAKISDGSIVNADISATANIDQSKISGLTLALADKEDLLPTGGTTSQYFRGDKTLGNFGTSVLATQLTGYSTGTAIPLVAADTIPQAIGKLDAYISSLSTNQSNYVLLNGTSAMSGNLQMGNNKITGLAAPTVASDAATKAYVDSMGQWGSSAGNVYRTTGNVGIGTTTPGSALEVAGQVKITGGTPGAGKVLTSDATGLATWETLSVGLPADTVPSHSVRVATNANIALSGTQTIDGVALIVGDRVLVKNQTANAQNGVYVVSAGAWTRATDLNSWNHLMGYRAVVLEGSAQAGLIYTPAAATSGTLGTSTIRFNSFGSSRLNENTAIGNFALNEINSGSDNIAIGAWSMGVATSAWSNTAVGNYALQNLTTGNRNAAFGADALLSNTDGYHNTAIGNEALEDNTSGFNNTGVGKNALSNTTTGSNNTALGYLAGSAITTGTNNVVIGSNDGAAIATSSNNILISDGGGNIRMHVSSTGDVGLGTSNPGAKLEVAGQVKITGGTPGAGKVLTSDATGLATWQTLAGGGSVTSVSGTAPIAVATGTTTPVVSISQANATTNGYLSSTDWNTFNDKQAALTAGATINGVVYPANGTQTLQIPLAPVNLTDAVNKQYVDSFGQWGTSAGNAYRTSGNVGIGTSTPTTALEVAGQVKITGGTPGAGKVLTSDADGLATWETAGSGSDNLGNHTATQNVQLGSFWLSGDGGNEGLSVDSSGKVGVGTSAPTFSLTVGDGTAVDGSIMAKGYGFIGSGLTLTEAGAGVRMFWYPKKAAFRAGEVYDTKWDDANIGKHSAAFGEDTTASGDYSFAAGTYNTVTGSGSAAFGWNNTASGVDSLAVGEGSVASGMASIALGTSATASAMRSVAIGEMPTASGNRSTAMGYRTSSNAFYQFTVGKDNLPLGTEDAITWIATDPLFVVGNGTGTGASRSNALMILKNGNIGMGTSAPSTKLEIAGQVKITGGSPGAGKVLTSDATGLASWTTVAGGTVTNVTGTAPISVATGTTTPAVSISQATTSTDGYLSSTDWNTFNDKQAALSTGPTINGIVYPANGTQTLQIPLAPVNLTDAVNKQYVDSFGHWGTSAGNVYRSSGNVGIGTTAPQRILHTNDSIGAIRIQRTSAGTAGPFIEFTKAMTGTDIQTESSLGAINLFPTKDGVGYSSARPLEYVTTETWNTTNQGYEARFFTRKNGTNFDEQRMTIDNDGNVGIGTSAPTINDWGGPSRVLHIHNPDTDAGTDSTVGLHITNGTTTAVANKGLVLGRWPDGTNTLGTYENERMVVMTNAIPRITVLETGNVGIGNVAPDERLVVYNGSTTGKYTATGWTHSSDARLKHDISPLENSLEKILKLRGVEYKFNSDPEKKTQVGFIAQEAEKIFPEVIVTDDKGFKSMVYANLVAPLVEAVKTLYKRILDFEKQQAVQNRQIASKADKVIVDSKVQKLEIENAKLRQENEEIKARLEKIEKVLNSKSGPL